ncbi:MAG: trehalose-phosphatase [Cellulomonadaceae bacterium]|nr:trehalose-phosphatase [Cellulomonadaceae bacterium]
MTGPLLIGLDFDGTLAPFVENPSESRMTQAARAAYVQACTAPDVAVALISGRDLENLVSVAQPLPGTYLVGSHGAESGRVLEDGTVEEHLVHLSPQQAAQLEALQGGFTQIAEQYPGAWVQEKPAAIVLHTRPCSEEDDADATAAAVSAATDLGVPPMVGKKVVEASVIETNKGIALTALRELTGAGRVVFAGDDVTDETAFAVLQPGDLGIKVGSGPTLATRRVSDANALAAELAALLTR